MSDCNHLGKPSACRECEWVRSESKPPAIPLLPARVADWPSTNVSTWRTRNRWQGRAAPIERRRWTDMQPWQLQWICQRLHVCKCLANCSGSSFRRGYIPASAAVSMDAIRMQLQIRSETTAEKRRKHRNKPNLHLYSGGSGAKS